MKKKLLIICILILVVADVFTTLNSEDNFYKLLMKGYENRNGYMSKLESGLNEGFFNKNTNHPLFKSIPVLMYHCIDNDVWGTPGLFVAPSEFQKQMAYLKGNGYTTITFRDLDHISQIPKPIIVTFDDGYKDNYTYAYPILKKYNMKATIFIIVNSLGKTRSLNIDEIREMKGTIDFQSHTMTHAHLGKLRKSRVEYEVAESKRQLEKLTGENIFVIAYPYGSYNSQTIETVKKYYKYGLTVRSGFFIDEPGFDDYQIDRVAVTNRTTLRSFIRSISNTFSRAAST